MPAAFASDPPVQWLTPLGLETAIERGFLDYWQARAKPAVERFLTALEQVEAEQAEEERDEGAIALSTRMRESWQRETYLVNLALNKSEVTDILYHARPALFPQVDPSECAGEIQAYQQHTKSQIASYERERVLRLKK